MLGNKCQKCGSEYFPPVSICKGCKSTLLNDIEMPQIGTLLSFTLQKESLAGYEEQEPMIFGLVKLANGIRTMGQIVDMPYENLRIGDKVRVVFRRVKVDGASGQIYYGYKFGPMRSTSELQKHH
jgi:scaffold protein (connect acetoacetyl-CoA thiolase and HMG-CoA synthase)